MDDVGHLVTQHPHQHRGAIRLAGCQTQQLVGDEDEVAGQRHGVGPQHVAPFHELDAVGRQLPGIPALLHRRLQPFAQALLSLDGQPRRLHALSLQAGQGGIAQGGVEGRRHGTHQHVAEHRPAIERHPDGEHQRHCHQPQRQCPVGAGPGNSQGHSGRRIDGPLDGVGQRQDPHRLAPQTGHAHHAVGVIQTQGQQREHITEEAGGHQPTCCQVPLEGIAPHPKGAPGLVPEPGGEVAPAHHQQETAARQHQQHHGGTAGDAQPAVGEHAAIEHREIQSQGAEQGIGIGRQIGQILQGSRRLDAEQRQQHRPVGVDQTDGQEGRRQDEHHRHQSRPQQGPEMQAAATDAVRMVHMAQPEMNRGVIPVGHGQRHGQGHHPGNQFLSLGSEAITGCPAAAQ